MERDVAPAIALAKLPTQLIFNRGFLVWKHQTAIKIQLKEVCLWRGRRIANIV